MLGAEFGAPSEKGGKELLVRSRKLLTETENRLQMLNTAAIYVHYNSRHGMPEREVSFKIRK